ncbi:MAG: hypothetical protein A3J28_12380 [Acidobacteria bacterium RIFCSPLOWO2_12_FULL_60_22]|nr:MAG: hypothetical protein A3J28_12380 [Acidobacteria bacterium RIFCSPLOWO2_12_FULL_60_22]
MAHPQVAAFARAANGGARPTRAIAGQNTLFTRTIHDMAYDPVRDEIIVPQFFAFAILTFRGDANGDVPPLRKIFGPSTQLKNSQALAVDPVHGEIFVPQGERVLVFSRDVNGDAAPLRILGGPNNDVDASRVTVDPVHNLLIVSGGKGIRIYNRTASGDAQPLRSITGPAAAGAVLMTTHPPSGMIFAAVRMEGRFEPQDFVGVWSVNDNGEVGPRWTVGGPNFLLKDVRGIAVDPKNKNVIVSDKTLNAVLTFHLPEAF